MNNPSNKENNTSSEKSKDSSALKLISKPVTAIILAAGKGTRMKSPLPKVLHPVAGEPMIVKIIDQCFEAGIADIRVVVGHGQNLVKTVIEGKGVHFCVQQNQLGTADAVKAADVETIEGDVMILNGDHPLLLAEDLKNFIKEFREKKLDLAVVSAKLKDPGDFGRIVRHHGILKAIVESRDASSDTLKINEVNTGIYLVNSDVLKDELPKIQNHNSKKEYYLTDLISISIEQRLRVDAIIGTPSAAFGVNSQSELAKATKVTFRRKNQELMEDGVLMIDPKTTYIENSVKIAGGAVIYPGVFIKGKTSIGPYTVIEPGCMISDSIVEDSVLIKSHSVLESCIVKSRAKLGPFARIRPDTEIGEEAHVGNFVELKKVKFGARSKANHLTYLGDAEVGTDSNIGCGTITCNYAVDKKKYKTKIGNRVFVGSDTQFIAPIEIGDDSVIGSGSTITKSVPAKALAVARGKQFIRENYISIPASEAELNKEK